MFEDGGTNPAGNQSEILHSATYTLCSEKNHPLTFSFISP